MNKKLSILALCCVVFSAIFGQNFENIYLNEIEVNADGAKLYSNLGRILTVIDKLEIEQSSARSIDELLEYVAGIDIRQRGVNGVQADISIRGGSFDQLLVLLNGTNITDPQTGHYNLDVPIELSDVSRVEILQGSAARLLGPNAFSGAINIITNDENQTKISSQSTAGNFGYFSQNLSGNLSTGNLRFFSSVSHSKSDGHIDNTDFENTNGYFQTKLTTKTVGTFDFQIGYQQKAFGANSFYSTTYPNQFEQTRTYLTAINWDKQTTHWKHSAQMYWRRHHDRFELFRDFEGAASFYTDHNYHLTDVTGIKWVSSYCWIGGLTSLGADIRNEHIFSTVLGNAIDSPQKVPYESGKYFTKEANRTINTIFADHSININKWYISAGAAGITTREFGFHMNGGLDIAYKPTPYSRIFVAVNSATRLPTFTDIYYQSPTQKSNPDIKPEQSLTYELGTKINTSHWNLAAIGYYRLGNNIIDWVKTSDSEIWESKNLTDVNAAGFDISCLYLFEKGFVKTAGITYSFLNLDKQAEGFDSKYALDFLKHKLVLSLNHSIWSNLSAHWRLTLNDRAGTYTDFATNNAVEFIPFWILNSKIMWQSKNITVFADLANILNTRYVDFGGIRQPGFNANIGFRLMLYK